MKWPDNIGLHEAVGQAIGAASMCWRPTPDGVFDSDRASRIMDELMVVILRETAGT